MKGGMEGGVEAGHHVVRRFGRVIVTMLTMSVAAAFVAGCGSSSTGPTTTGAARSGTSATSSTAAGSETAGCGNSVSPGSTTLSLTIDGRSRVVIVHVPTGYSPTTETPLVLNMHGSGSTAAEQEAFTGMDSTADSDGFIVAYPQALIPDGSGFDWNVPGVPLIGGRTVPAGSANDVAFLTTLVSSLEQRYCIDSSRVYATGFSGGARITSQLACDSSTTFAAVAPVSGLRRPTPCPTRRAVPILAFHGTADPVDPYDGHGQPYWTYSVPQAALYWAQQDDCSTSASTTQPRAGVTLTEYSGCSGSGNVKVGLYSISGEGHEWPGGPALPTSLTRELGPQSSAIDADSTMWVFFQANPMP